MIRFGSLPKYVVDSLPYAGNRAIVAMEDMIEPTVQEAHEAICNGEAEKKGPGKIKTCLAIIAALSAGAWTYFMGSNFYYPKSEVAVAQAGDVLSWFDKVKAKGTSLSLNNRFDVKGVKTDQGNHSVVVDNDTGLMWRQSGRDLSWNFGAVSFFEALKIADDTVYAGYDDWRLPTKEEWKTIIDNTYGQPSVPREFKNMETHYPYWTKTYFVYGKEYTCIHNICPLQAVTARLYFGRFAHQIFQQPAFVMIVRGGDPDCGCIEEKVTSKK